MSLKRIIFVDDENTKVMIRASTLDYHAEKLENGCRCVEVGTRKPLDGVLKRFAAEEWAKAREWGARLATRSAQVNGGIKMKWFKKSNPANGGSIRPAPSARILWVSDYLSDKSILFFPQETPREEIIFKLIGALGVEDHASALHAVLEREKAGGTVIDSAISIPHARLKGLKTIELAVGLCGDPASPKDRPRLFFLFLSPKEDTKIHLLFLSSLAALFQTEGFEDELLRLKTSHEVVHKVRQLEKGV